MPTFITPPGNAGSAELTTTTGLTVIDAGAWKFSQSGYNDGVTWGVSLGGPLVPAPGAPVADPTSGVLHLRAQVWHIAVIGTELIPYTDPNTGVTYGAERCRILVTGRWHVTRRPNSNSFNGQGVIYRGTTDTDEGGRSMTPALLSYATVHDSVYIIQGSAVAGGAQDTFSPHVWFCKCEESVTTDNSNRAFQSNSVASPRWVYRYQRSWQID
jgi:hypothetical protein